MAITPPSLAQAGETIGAFLGLPPPKGADLPHLAGAAAVSLALFLLARLVVGRLESWLDRRVAPRFALAEHRHPFPSRKLAAAMAALAALVALDLVAAAYAWPAYSALLFDISVTIAVAALVWNFAGALHFTTSTRLALALVSDVHVLATRYERLHWMRQSLDSLAVSIGETRISLLDIINIVLAAVVLYALVRLANGAVKVFIRRNSGFDITQRLLVEKVAAIAIAVVAIFVGIDMLGIDTTALSIFSGTIGLGLGFGLQKIFSNLVSGLILLMDRSIKPGDVIVVGESVGEVKKIGTRAVSVITRDGKEHLVPNELLMTERVENWNYSSRDVRIRMSVKVAYDADLDLAESLIHEALRDSPRVLNSPASAVRITGLNDNGVNLEIRFWISDPEDGLGNIQSEIFKRVLTKFRENAITIANPAREIAITDLPPILTRPEVQPDRQSPPTGDRE